jgi:hypothetical protein
LNHLHLLVRLDPETVKNWSDEEVIRRWARLFPPRDKMRRPLEPSDDWVKGHRLNAAWIKPARERLASLSWFMKCLKEPLARLANQQDQASGAFLKGRSYCLHSPDLTNWENSDVLRLTRGRGAVRLSLVA